MLIVLCLQEEDTRDGRAYLFFFFSGRRTVSSKESRRGHPPESAPVRLPFLFKRRSSETKKIPIFEGSETAVRSHVPDMRRTQTGHKRDS